MKNFNIIISILLKNPIFRYLRGGGGLHEKKNLGGGGGRSESPKKGDSWIVCRFKRGLGKYEKKG